jgi:hypothetical protein
MSTLRDKAIRLLNNLSIGTKSVKLGELVLQQGAAVPNAAGAAPTAAEFNALLDSLRNAEKIAR